MSELSPWLDQLSPPAFNKVVARLEAYALRYWLRRDRTRWPTVRECAHRMTIRHGEVEALVESSERLELTSFPGDHPIGDYFVERTDSAALWDDEEPSPDAEPGLGIT